MQTKKTLALWLASTLVATGLVGCSVPGGTTAAFTPPSQNETVNGELELAGIQIVSYPTKTDYLEGEKINLVGLNALGTFSDGSTIALDYTYFTPAKELVEGTDTEVVFSYGSFTFEYAITVVQTTKYYFEGEGEELYWTKRDALQTSTSKFKTVDFAGAHNGAYIGGISEETFTFGLYFESSLATTGSVFLSLGRGSGKNLTAFADILEFHVNGTKISPTVTMPITGWEDFREYKIADVPLKAGYNEIVFTSIDRDGQVGNLDYLALTTNAEITAEKPQTLRIEAENTTGINGAAARNEAGGQTASGVGEYKYIGGLDYSKGGISFNVDSVAKQSVSFYVCFGLSNFSFNASDYTLTLNGTALAGIDALIPDSPYDNWFDWNTIYIGQLDLEANSTNTITFYNTNNGRGTNIDFIEFAGASAVTSENA